MFIHIFYLLTFYSPLQFLFVTEIAQSCLEKAKPELEYMLPNAPLGAVPLMKLSENSKRM